MKIILLLITFFSSILLHSQSVIIKNILSINTFERNVKEVLFQKKTSDSNSNFVLKAENRSSKDFTKCKWISLLSKEQLIDFLSMLENSESGSSLDSPLFTVVYKKKKIKIQIKSTKCTAEHKTHYFQKTCNRELSFVILDSQISKIVSELRKELQNI